MRWFDGLDGLADEVEVVEPADVDSRIDGGVGGDAIPGVGLDEADDAVTGVALNLDLADSHVADATEEVIAESSDFGGR